MIFIIKKIKYIIVAVFLLFFSDVLAQITYESAFPNIVFEFPAELQSPNDGTNRMFVVEQLGRIKVFPIDPIITSVDVNTFLDITSKVFFTSGEEIGLLGLAFHPDFSNNGYFYVYYTASSPVEGISIRMVLSRYSVDPNNTNLADPNSELIIFQSR